MLSLWGDMHDLSQILHIPGNDSILTFQMIMGTKGDSPEGSNTR